MCKMIYFVDKKLEKVFEMEVIVWYIVNVKRVRRYYDYRKQE